MAMVKWAFEIVQIVREQIFGTTRFHIKPGI